MRFWLSALVALGLLGGCRFVTVPDPNDVAPGQNIEPQVLHSKLDSAWYSLQQRVAARQITSEQADELLQQYIRSEVAKIEVEAIPDSQAWSYGEAFAKAHEWETAEMLLSRAVEVAADEDRRVNDLLSLAHVKAEQGEVEEAIALTRQTLDADPRSSAPILPAVLLEIVPAAMDDSRSHAGELADLLMLAIEVHKRTIVNAKSDAGRAFFVAKSHHIGQALATASRLYYLAGQEDDAATTQILLDEFSRSYVRT